MKPSASGPSAPGPAASATATTGSQSAEPATAHSHTNATPPPAVLARTFHAACATAATRTSASAAVGIRRALAAGRDTSGGRYERRPSPAREDLLDDAVDAALARRRPLG